ncbi:MAG: hypothetical protein HWE35_04180 [Rhodobacteraceae bacterium]|nr:hypothetical protein [Paracoccaceae bacterium]
MLVHIGKCGGSTLRQELQNRGKDIRIAHIRQPPLGPQFRYYITLRSPLRRALSAFNWRRKLVLEEASQPDRFPGEAQILAHYGSLDALARALYFEDGTDNALAQGNFRSIHHLGEGIAFYLEPLLAAVQPDQIAGVLMQETLDADLQRLFGIQSSLRLNDNSQAAAGRPGLSAQGEANLRRYLAPDYACIRTLGAWRLIPPQVLQQL